MFLMVNSFETMCTTVYLFVRLFTLKNRGYFDMLGVCVCVMCTCESSVIVSGSTVDIST